MMQLSQLIRRMIRERWMIYYLTVGFGLIMLIYGLIVPKKYQSEGRILPQQQEGGMLGLSSLIAEAGRSSGGRIASVAKAAGLSLGTSPSDMLKAFLSSRTLMEKVIIDLNLFQEFKIKNRSMEMATKQLRPMITVDVTREDLLIVTARSKRPQLAADLVNSFITNLDLFLKEKSMTKGKYERVFLGERLTTASNELTTAEESLQAYQQRHKTILPSEELKAAIKAYADLKLQLFAKELEYEIADRYTASDNPYITTLSRERRAFRNKIEEIESADSAGKGFGVGFGISFRNLPAVQTKYLRRYRDVRVKEEVYAFILQQFEQAKIMEVRDTPTITILDRGRVPERKIAPKRLKLVVLGLIIGFLIGLLAVVFSDFYSGFRRDERSFPVLRDLFIGLKSDLVVLRAVLRKR